jgi:hypothetical protein
LFLLWAHYVDLRHSATRLLERCIVF